ncbi:MAG: oligosaccharide flippase family protein [Chloroflexota bacterium]|nr:oligosaccharide flippase family protein [Chloroflexota bacterium]
MIRTLIARASHQGAPTLGRNTAILLVSNIGGAALSFVIAAVIGRALGERGLGVYAVAMAWVYPLSLVVEFGLGTLMTRDLAGQPERAHDYLIDVIRVRLLLGVPTLLVLIAAAPLLSSDSEIVAGLHVSAPLVLIVPLTGAFTAVFRAQERMTPVAALNVGMLAAQAALTAVVLAAGAGVVVVLIVNTATSAGQLVAAWGMYRATSPPNPLTVSERGRSLLRRAFPFALAALFAALQNRLSIIMLENLTTTAEVGLFAAAYRFTEAARMFPNAFFGAIFPTLTALAADPARMERTFRRALVGLTAFGIASGVGLTIFAPILLTLIYGDAFAAGASSLALLSWALALSVLRGLWTIRAYAHRRESRVNAVNALVIALQVALGLVLIPRFGVDGAALTHLIIEAAALMLFAGLGWGDARTNA